MARALAQCPEGILMSNLSLPVLTNVQMLEIETLAMRGLPIETISVLLRLDLATFRRRAESDPRGSEALLLGRNRGVAAVAKSLYEAAISGRDTGAARFFLERVAGGQWAPPRVNPPVVVIESRSKPAAEAEAMQLTMEKRFERQRLLREGRDIDADGNVIELAVGATANTPTDGAGEEPSL